MKKYKHLFFDLDHTLWDFEKNAEECLLQIFEEFNLRNLGPVSFNEFFDSFSRANKDYWARLEAKQIDAEHIRRNRFKTALANVDILVEEEFGLEINEAFLDLLPYKRNLLPGAMTILESLSNEYDLHIISNGWYDVQIQKMKSSGIDHFFDKIVTNEKANARKPDKEIFMYTLNITGADISNSIMIGDNLEADILGARSVGLDTIFYNPDKLNHEVNVTFEVEHLLEIEGILG